MAGALNTLDVNIILNRIKDQLPVKEHIRFQLKQKLRLHLLSSVSTERIPSCCRGRTHYSDGYRLYLFLTNCRGVNHLDLAEYAIHYTDARVAEDVTYLEAIIDDGPLVDPTPGNRRYAQLFLFHNDLPPLDTAIDDKLLWIRRNMRKHYEIGALMSLLDRWNIGKFALLVRNYLVPSMERRREDGVDAYRQYLSVAVAGCAENSDAAVASIAEIAGHAMAQYRDALLTTYEHVFFRCHVERAGLPYGHFEGRVPRQDLLYNAFMTGDERLMRLGLELEWRSGYISPVHLRRHPAPPFPPRRREEICVETSIWPRMKDPVQPINYRSFYSIEYYAAFSYLAVWTAIRTGLDRRFVGLFRLLWRAIPTPYLPIADMRWGVDFQRVMGSFLRDSINRRIVEPKVWALLTEAFDEDSSAEFKPRTLKHLCRFTVRRRMRSPEQITSLNLPKSLEQYLLLES